MVNTENERFIYKVLVAGVIFTYIHYLCPTDTGFIGLILVLSQSAYYLILHSQFHSSL